MIFQGLRHFIHNIIFDNKCTDIWYAFLFMSILYYNRWLNLAKEETYGISWF